MVCTKLQGAECTWREATGWRAWTHNVFMATEDDSSAAIDGEPDWYLREWASFKNKKQAGLSTELDIHKTTAHRLWTGQQPYRRDFLNMVARWLEIQPYELLMHPDEAIALRRLRETALQIAAEDARRPIVHAPAARAG